MVGLKVVHLVWLADLRAGLKVVLMVGMMVELMAGLKVDCLVVQMVELWDEWWVAHWDV